ncbi:MAG TPA: alanine--tRNA ligase [Lentisphaerae bacterium]|nr:alanine--tRNA ligase [Lentisphaerota bacterium]
MTSSEIRQSFLDFFAERGHEIVPSSPVVLPTDPTLLFANAGMNQFKEIFLGARKSSWKRVANTQKCIRVSGKHNDLEEVGRDTYHHTFFEMLGNWSFGDYYKREAITWAWELLTQVWKLPKNRLWVTVYTTDDEAADIWRTCTDVDPAHILRFGEKDNFWEMGDTGPCGPCSEIHFDLTPNGCTPDMVNAGTPDVIEIWNNVFMQYNRKSDGTLDDLPAKCVDTGMGFERIVAVIQGKKSNYDTDVFTPLIQAISQRSGQPYTDGENAVAMRVIADHLRALSFAIADGVMPSNDGRGYVLRRLLRRAARFGRNLGLNKPFLCELFPVLEKQMGGFFPELTARRAEIIRALRAEEESFAHTLDRGIALFDETVAELQQNKATIFPGDQAFKLYDTYGFPYDLTVLMAGEKNLTVDQAAFDECMAAQRARARAARKNDAAATNDMIAQFVAQGIKSTFIGYTALTADTEILAILADGHPVPSLAAGQHADILLQQTPFYAESGGQIGDTGTITTPQGARFEVTDTQKPADGIILHKGQLTAGALTKGDTVSASVDATRRAAIRRHHTATHLLNAALRKVLATDSIKQAGSYVAPDRLRFDFTWFEALTPAQIADIENLVTEYIIANKPVTSYEMDLKDVPGSGIIAVFDEKYGDTVRVVETEGISRELCGGTHVERSGDIGPFRIIAETSIAAGIRRIEAQTGLSASAHTLHEHSLLAAAAHQLSISPAELPERITALVEQVHRLEKELKAAAEKGALEKGAALANQFAPINGIPVLIESVGELSADPLRALVESLRKQTPDSVILLAATADGKATFILNAGPAAQAKGLHAGKLVGAIAKVAGGGGGGKPDKAQAGGKNPDKLPDALATARELITQALT